VLGLDDQGRYPTKALETKVLGTRGDDVAVNTIRNEWENQLGDAVCA
jgi:hypothetical protein